MKKLIGKVPLSAELGEALNRLQDGELFYLRYPRGELQECRVTGKAPISFMIVADANGPIADEPVVDILFDRFGTIIELRIGD